MNYVFLILFSILAYFFISLLGYLTQGTSPDVVIAVKKMFSLRAFLSLVIGNMFWVAAVYYGFLETQFALPITLSIGVITAFVFSIFAYQTQVHFSHFLGLVFIILGIFLLYYK